MWFIGRISEAFCSASSDPEHHSTFPNKYPPTLLREKPNWNEGGDFLLTPPRRPKTVLNGRDHRARPISRISLPMQNTIGSHEPALVSPQDFLDRMTHLWSEPPFNMNTTPALLSGWRVMADHYRRAALSNLNDDPLKPSFVLPLPTGSGKTEGTCVYAALQAARNLNHPRPLGVLIVTRLISDADKVVDKINTLAGRSLPLHTIARRDTALW